ncbi:MAG: helix-turn-helix domain-containing protein [Planctomycetota bacterium]
MTPKAPKRRHRDPEWLAQRRQDAAKLFRRGIKLVEVSRRLQVSLATVHSWRRIWQEHGSRGLRQARPPGRPSRLGPDQLAKIEQALLLGARHHGYPSDSWTLQRVGEVITKITRVKFHPSYVWHILRNMGWSLRWWASHRHRRSKEAMARALKAASPKAGESPGKRRARPSSKTGRGSPGSHR